MAISEGKEKGTGIIFKAVMVKNFPHLGREMDILDLWVTKDPKEVEPVGYATTHYH